MLEQTNFDTWEVMRLDARLKVETVVIPSDIRRIKLEDERDCRHQLPDLRPSRHFPSYQIPGGLMCSACGQRTWHNHGAAVRSSEAQREQSAGRLRPAAAPSGAEPSARPRRAKRRAGDPVVAADQVFR
jgi:hypothetical protein